ncbi:hypothetical protein FKW77_001399 [Venturia effusa]|uniref:Uncharacterized protein n=1 Tax=Venturia effusa TaxID=50376 RepID=A0A517L8L9_9PEZI|nr:hypothetical protein FKW77_001399 [Venturia effusa]
MRPGPVDQVIEKSDEREKSLMAGLERTQDESQKARDAIQLARNGTIKPEKKEQDLISQSQEHRKKTHEN